MNERYSRQMLFQPIGPSGQQKLSNSRVVIVGMGALGTVLANHMVRAGIGYVRIIDRDYVEWSNLQRQMLYEESDAQGMVPKAEAAAARLRLINREITIDAHVADLNSWNAEELLGGTDLILDGSDNFGVRFLINDVAVKHNIPWIYGGAVSTRGVSQTIIPGKTPCLRCLFGDASGQTNTDTCDTIGVLGPIIHVIASRQSIEALKWLTGNESAMDLRLWQTDLWTNQAGSIDTSTAKNADCLTCARHQFDFLEQSVSGNWTQSLCGRNSVQVNPPLSSNIDLEQFEQIWKALGETERNPFLLRLHLPEHITLVLFKDGRLLVQGTSDLLRARSLYSRYVGN